jgi:pyridoxal phosphate enzyme (YggS family)
MMSGSSSANNDNNAETTTEVDVDETTTEVDVGANFHQVQDRVTAAAAGTTVRLVAISKTKPLELLQQVYDNGGRCFGENHVQELVTKVPAMPLDCQWHFIGALQSNKANRLVQAMNGSIDRLTVETVSSTKLATKLNTAVNNSSETTADQRLSVFVQVNMSEESSKSGVSADGTTELCRHILEQCPRLELRGLMTIGAAGDVTCFTTLVDCQSKVLQDTGIESLELSMGMSGDFEEAIHAGATNVRVGSTIFGQRDYSK